MVYSNDILYTQYSYLHLVVKNGRANFFDTFDLRKGKI
jgi:hypothetical protein